jgi:hypothetical protein
VLSVDLHVALRSLFQSTMLFSIRFFNDSLPLMANNLVILNLPWKEFLMLYG